MEALLKGVLTESGNESGRSTRSTSASLFAEELVFSVLDEHRVGAFKKKLISFVRSVEEKVGPNMFRSTSGFFI